MSNTGEFPPQIQQTLSAMDTRLGRIEDKLDDHLVRVSKAETSINWIQGHLRIATSIILAVMAFLGVTLFNILFHK